MTSHIINISLLINKISLHRLINAACWCKVDHFSSWMCCCSDQVVNLTKNIKFTIWSTHQCFYEEESSTLHQHAKRIIYFELRTVIFSAKFFTTYLFLNLKIIPSKTEKTLRLNFLAVKLNQRLNEKSECDIIYKNEFKIYKEHGVKMEICPKAPADILICGSLDLCKDY